MFKSTIKITLVGDPRQATYSTVNTEKNAKYKKAGIVNFFADEVENLGLDIEHTMLNENFRCFHEINDFANKLYPQFTAAVSNVRNLSGHDGVYLLPEKYLDIYMARYNPTQLRWSRKILVDERYPILNFGNAKGLTFDRVVIYPTTDMLKWIQDNSVELKPDTRSKFYVALTRPRQSVAIVYDGSNQFNTNELQIYSPE